MVFSGRKSKEEQIIRYGNYSYLLDIRHNNDRLFMNDLIYDYYYYRDNAGNRTKMPLLLFFFLLTAVFIVPGKLFILKALY